MKTRFKISVFFLLVVSLILSSCSLFSHRLPERDVVVQTGLAAKDTLGSEFSVLVWNVYKTQKENWRTEFEKINQGHDLLIFQEDVCCERKEQQGRFKIFAKSFSYESKATGVSTISSSTAIDSQYLRSTGREPVINTPKMALVTRYRLADGNIILVANIHSLNFVSNETWNGQLQHLINKIKDHKGPMILAGDFNTWNSSRIEILHKSVKELGLHPVKINGEDNRMAVFGYPLDHVFSRKLKITKARVIPSDGSDHLPISIKFEISDEVRKLASTHTTRS